MANKKSAKKRAKQSEVKRLRNNMRKSSVRTAVKKFLTALDTGVDVAQVKDIFKDTAAQLARAAGKGVYHKNTASRKISRLAKKVAQYERA